MTTDKKDKALRDLNETILELLSPSGCPWDRSQTLKSIAPYLVEESWEFVDAATNMENGEMAEELGDILMLVLLACAIGEKKQLFSLQEVAFLIKEKLIRRHPHVFEKVKVSGTEDVRQNWKAIKRKEGKVPEEDGLPSIPNSFPALTIAMKIGKAASSLGFEWPDVGGPLGKISEEWEELKEAVARDQQRNIEHETGDLLFAITNLCRFTEVDPETALRKSCSRFRNRFMAITRNTEKEGSMNLAKMEQYWKKAKEEEQ